MNKRLGDMTIEELCDEMVTRAKEQGVLPAVIVNMYAGCIKDENARLRALVKEMADALDNLTCRATRCLSEDDPCDDECFHVKNRALVDRAREVTK